MGGKKHGGRTAAVAASLAFALLCGGAFVLAATGKLGDFFGSAAPGGSQQADDAASGAAPARRDFADYSWEELSAIASRLEGAHVAGEAEDIAREYGMVGDDGELLDCVHDVELADGRLIRARLVGVLADDLADGSGRAGLTFMAALPTMRPMNPEATSAGGWEASGLRAWLAGEGKAQLSEDVAGRLVAVSKETNNRGAVSGALPEATATSDELWLFSASELFGALSWFANEYGDSPIPNTGYTDFAPYDELISSEGAQYAWFAQNGVADRDGGEVVAAASGMAGSTWWLRTPYPVSLGGESDLFYTIGSNGYPSGKNSATMSCGVVVGFCL